MNELKIQINQKPGVISTNFEDIKKQLSAQMDVYKELEVTEENKPERKKDVATLRKIIKSLNDKRIGIKKDCLKPYNAFEKQVTELVAIINNPITILDNQIKDFEEAQRLQKQSDIDEAFDIIKKDYPSLTDEIGLVTIYDNRWENIGVSMKSVREDMVSKMDKIKADVDLIKSMPSDKTEEALKLFWGDLDVTRAITMINRYEQQKKEIEKRVAEQQKKEQAEAIEREVARAKKAEREAIEKEKKAEREATEKEERIREEERRKAAEKEEAIREEERRKAAEQEESIREQERLTTEQRLMGIKEATEQTEFIEPKATDIVTYKIIGTSEELEQVEMYMNSIGVEFIKGEF